MQDEIFRLVNGATLVGAESTSSRSDSGGNKDSRPRQEIEWPHLTGDVKENTILVLVEKIFWVGLKITNF